MKIFLTTLLAALVLALYPGYGYAAALTEAPAGNAGAEAGAKSEAPGGKAGAKAGAKAEAPGGKAGAETGAKAEAPGGKAGPKTSAKSEAQGGKAGPKPGAKAEAPGGKAGAEAGAKSEAPGGKAPPIKPLVQPAGTPGGTAQGTNRPLSGGFFTGVYEIGDAANGIGFSRHNLGKYGGGTPDAIKKESNFEICVYCHTPHTPAKKDKPVWAGEGPLPTNYTAYGTSVPGLKPSTAALGSPSLACLSCHDGMAAPDSIANSPGKRKTAAVETPASWGFLLDEGSVDPAILSTGLLLAADRTNDHPVNVLFRGGQVASLRPSRTIISQIDLNSGLRMGNRPRLSNLWSIKGYISDTASIGDLLRDGRIECSSCHDPHFNNKSWREVDYTFRNWDDMDGLFLRRVGGNFASGVCRTCHQK